MAHHVDRSPVGAGWANVVDATDEYHLSKTAKHYIGGLLEHAPEKEATRIEYRSPDPACNPYLAFAAMLGAGLAGIEAETELPIL